jgi:hypothetical protein
MTPERTTVRLLADKNGVQDSLPPAVERWTRKYGDKHPLEAKLTPRRTLHDRAIFVDGKGAWVLASRLRWMSVARDSTASSAAQIAVGGRALGIQSNRCPSALGVFSRHAPEGIGSAGVSMSVVAEIAGGARATVIGAIDRLEAVPAARKNR